MPYFTPKNNAFDGNLDVLYKGIFPNCQTLERRRSLSQSVVVITPPLPRDGGTARTVIQVHAVNLIELGLGKDGSPFRNSHEWLVAPPPARRTAIGGYPRVAFYDMLG